MPEKLDLYLSANSNDEGLEPAEKSKRVALMGRLTGMTEEWCTKLVACFIFEMTLI
jgi:hypothetical protein